MEVATALITFVIQHAPTSLVIVLAPAVYIAVLFEGPNRRLVRLIRAWRKKKPDRSREGD